MPAVAALPGVSAVSTLRETDPVGRGRYTPGKGFGGQRERGRRGLGRIVAGGARAAARAFAIAGKRYFKRTEARARADGIGGEQHEQRRVAIEQDVPGAGDPGQCPQQRLFPDE